jgi:outer membrane protein assembly factor BamB
MLLRSVLGTLLSLSLVVPALGADWPMSRFDAHRSAASPQELAADLHLQWIRQLPPLKPGWADQPKMQFDAAYEPVILGQLVLVASSLHDSVTAYDTRTGAEKWTFLADGPVRFAPVGWEGKLYVVSDDGYLYCLDAAKGTLLWKFRGGPSDRKVLGNGRLVSSWPARGAPVIVDGTVYFAASIWPFMGVFIHALDARTGSVLWTNSGDGAIFMKQPHMADSFAGVAPQGAFVIVGDKLLIPGGRSVPACYDRKTGKLLHYRLAENGKNGGGSDVAALGNLFVNGGAAFELDTGEYLGPFGEHEVLTDDALYSGTNTQCEVYEFHGSLPVVETPDRKGNLVRRAQWPPATLGTWEMPRLTALIKAGSRLYAGSAQQVAAIDLPLPPNGQPPVISWQAGIAGKPVHLAAADDRLFVSTLEGRLYCFGKDRVNATTHAPPAPGTLPADQWTLKAREILDRTRLQDGYCVAWGVGSGRLIAELVRQSRLNVLAVDPDANHVEALRREFAAAGISCDRLNLYAGDPMAFSLPPYLANLMVSEDLRTAGLDASPEFLKKVFASLRPYGGVALLPVPADKRGQVLQTAGALNLPGAQVRDAGDGVSLSREGALPGSANWTHEHADAANTRVSRDVLVKAPLGVLWFGGPAHDGILPRHGHGPQPQVIDGRLIIEGVDFLRAVDIYTGRVLWEVALPGLGKLFNNTSHQPGANESGTNYVSMADGIYVAYGKVCLRLDPATGAKMGEFRLPGDVDSSTWEYLNVHDDYLVGGGDPTMGDHLTEVTEDSATSKRLVVLDRHSGKQLWSIDAQASFRHNGICLGGGRLYAIDRLAGELLARLRRRGQVPAMKSRLLAYDLKTGKELWSTDDEVFGTWLSYSATRDVLVEAGRVVRDALSDEPKGMRAFRAADGTMLWQNKDYAGPSMIHGDTVLKDQSACNLLTGAPVQRRDPLTGREVPWTWTRSYGCNTPAASENLLTFRSGAAGYFDLANDGGTGNLGGFRSSCTNNLIVAGGLLNAPDYTRTCTCSYQNQCSLALVTMPEAEMWTYFGSQEVKGPVRRVGINFGAPGDRKADDGTLWLDYPRVGGQSPTVPVSVTGTVEWFRRHASQVDGAQSWVSASGGKGIASATVTLGADADPERVYTVRLHFAEPDGLAAGRRVFHVALQGQEVLHDFDIAREAGGPNRRLVKEIKGVRVQKELTVTLTPAAAGKEPVLCGVEVLAEGW